VLHRYQIQSLIVAAVILLLPAASSWARESALTGLTVKELSRIEKGRVVIKTDAYFTEGGMRSARIRAYCVINKSPTAVWAIMLNYHQFGEFMPQLESIEVLEKTQSTMKVTETIQVPFPFSSISYTLDLLFTPTQRSVSWTLDKSRKHDIADTFGTWEFFPYGQGKTLLRYSTTVDTGLPVPRFLEDFMLKSALSDTLLSLKRRTESNGTWKKK